MHRLFEQVIRSTSVGAFGQCLQSSVTSKTTPCQCELRRLAVSWCSHTSVCSIHLVKELCELNCMATRTIFSNYSAAVLTGTVITGAGSILSTSNWLRRQTYVRFSDIVLFSKITTMETDGNVTSCDTLQLCMQYSPNHHLPPTTTPPPPRWPPTRIGILPDF